LLRFFSLVFVLFGIVLASVKYSSILFLSFG
jgi:hypothetical protein